MFRSWPYLLQPILNKYTFPKPSLQRLNKMDCALRIKMMFLGSGPSTLRDDREHRKSYALLTCSKMSWENNTMDFSNIQNKTVK